MTRRNDGGAAAAADDEGGSLLPFPPPGEEGGSGILPVLPPGTEVAIPDKNPRSNAATAATAAGVRAFTAQAVAFYFRAPVKAFFRTRVDYLAYARSVQQAQQAQARAGAEGNLSFARRLALWARGTTPGVLTSAIKHHGWRVVPDQVLPPLLANVGVGAVLYTSYLQILGRLHEESAKASRRVYPPPEPAATFAAGFLAGSVQSVVAAPLDAIQARYDHRQLFAGENGSNGKPQSIWAFSTAKLREIGFRGIFAGWGLSWMKDSFGNAVFFSTFEYVKAQGFYKFVRWYYGGLNEDLLDILARKRPTHDHRLRTEGLDPGSAPLIIRPHYAIEPAFLLLAGVSASVAQQVLLHPLTNIQMEHWDHLEDLDEKARKLRERRAKEQQLNKTNESTAGRPPGNARRRWRMLRAYYHAYQETWQQCKGQAAAEGQGVPRWLWRGFWWNTIRQVPSTSAGLIIFELVRRKYGFDEGEVRITRDGYDILLK